MSYQHQAALVQDGPFNARTSACLTEQAETYMADTRADIVALATSWLCGGIGPTGPLLAVWMPIMAAEPGMADQAANPDGTVDSSRISDQAILSAVQANWPRVAGLLYTPEGAPKP
jgi:hypothetical protein